jgi:glycosyltransferase involved in cell wall biosynthesis
VGGNYSYCPRLIPWLLEHAHEYDAVIVNGLWQYHGLATRRAMRRLGRPYYVFTHGMLDPWFKRTYPLKHLKKWLYWPWAEYRVLRDAAAVLFTCQEERLLARQSFWLYRVNEEVVSLGTGLPPTDSRRLREAFVSALPQLRGKRLVLFLGRIHEKKGCDLLVKAFASVAAAVPELHLVMAGPDQTGLVPKLQALALAAGVADRICWVGMLQSEMKWGAFYAAEVFALPSHQENFGIAVAESLGCGLPVLISDKVNIWREIEADGAGIVGPDTLKGTEQGLRHWLGLTDEERARFQERALASFNRRFTAKAMAESLLDVLARGPQVASAAPLGNAIGAREGADRAG